MKLKHFLFMAIAVAVALAGCKENTPEPEPIPVITITAQPTAPTALVEGSVAGDLTVAATVTEGAALSYQWYTNTSAGTVGGTEIDGATAASYVLPATLTEGTYYYFCEVSAPDAASVRTNAVTVTVSSRYPVTGKAGTLDWSLDREGTLTVSGTGAMPDYAAEPAELAGRAGRADAASVTRAARAATSAPWGVYAAEIKAVVIAEGVTSVGDNAFAGLAALTGVTLPDSVESIGDGAFAECSLLIEINIPDGTIIGDGAFEGCDKLPEVVTPEVSLQDALDGYEARYADMAEAYAAIDDAYSTLAARQSVTVQTAALWEFWQAAYGVVEFSNVIHELIDSDGTMSEAEKNERKVRASLHRGMAYMYLGTLFGDVPVTEDVVMPWMEIPSIGVKEVLDFALENFDMAANMLAGDEMAQAVLAKMTVAASRKDHQSVAMSARELLDSGTTALNDTNADGTFNAADKNAANLTAVQARLLGAEAALALGNAMDATPYLAGLAAVTPGATLDETRAAVNALWPSWNDGVKFMNAARWGETSSWGKYALMPIPAEALAVNARLTQNQGW